MSKGSNRTLCIEHGTFEYVTFAFMILPAVLIIPVLWDGLRESSQLQFKPLQKVYWMTSFFLLSAAMIRPFLYYLNVFDCYNFNGKAATSESSVATYNLSLICICILYTSRIHSVFRFSPYPLSKCTLSIISFTFFAQCVMAFFTSYFNHLVWISILTASPDDIAYNFKLAFKALISFRAINTVYNIALLLLFLRKTYQISRNLAQHAVHNHNAQRNNDKMRRVVQSAIVYTLCLLMAFLSTLIVNVFGILRTNAVTDTNELYLAHQTSIQWDIFVTALTIYFQFDSVRRKLAACCLICNWRMKEIVNELEECDHEQVLFIETDTFGATTTTGDTTANSRASTFTTANATTHSSHLV